MTTKLQAPAGVTAVSFANQQFDVAADGTITFDGPEEARAVAHFRAAGFTDPVPAKKAKGAPSAAVTEALQKIEADEAALAAAAAQQ